jgi:hypothetical protein
MTVWFQRERCEALQSVAIVGHVLSSMVMSVVENSMEAEKCGLIRVVQVMLDMRDWLGDL